jgi:hypothetical protein
MAKRAAVEAVGGGHAVGVERRDDGKAALEVEVERDGREIEVNLGSDLGRVGAVTEDDADEDENDEREGGAED